MFFGKTSNRHIPLGKEELRCLKFRFNFLSDQLFTSLNFKE